MTVHRETDSPVNEETVTAPYLTLRAQEAIGAFWEIHERYWADDTLRGSVHARPFLEVLFPTPADARAYGDLRNLAVRRGDWAPFLGRLRVRGAEHAARGTPLSDWIAATAAFKSTVLARLVPELRESPEALSIALEGLEQLSSIALCAIADAYSTAKESLIRAEQSRHRQILEGAPDAILATDGACRITDWNATAEQMFGHPRVAVLGEVVQERLLLEGASAEINRSVARYRETGDEALLRRRISTIGLRANGQSFPLELSLVPIRIDGDVGFCAFLRDVSERKRIEASLARQAAELQRINQELADFAYVASHDLRAPLRAVNHLSRWIAADLGESVKGETAEHLRLLRARVQRMDRMIEDLLAYSRAGRENAEVERLSVSELVRDVVSTLGVHTGFRVVWAEDLPSIETPRPPLEHVVANLVTNAIKHHHRGEGLVEIAWTDLGEVVELSVSDDGPGIPDQDRERALRPFQTLKARDEVEGTGIGLSIVKKTVQAYGGRLVLSQGKHGGLEVRFTWPKRWSQGIVELP